MADSLMVRLFHILQGSAVPKGLDVKGGFVMGGVVLILLMVTGNSFQGQVPCQCAFAMLHELRVIPHPW